MFSLLETVSYTSRLPFSDKFLSTSRTLPCKLHLHHLFSHADFIDRLNYFLLVWNLTGPLTSSFPPPFHVSLSKPPFFLLPIFLTITAPFRCFLQLDVCSLRILCKFSLSFLMNNSLQLVIAKCTLDPLDTRITCFHLHQRQTLAHVFYAACSQLFPQYKKKKTISL